MPINRGWASHNRGPLTPVFRGGGTRSGGSAPGNTPNEAAEVALVDPFDVVISVIAPTVATPDPPPDYDIVDGGTATAVPLSFVDGGTAATTATSYVDGNAFFSPLGVLWESAWWVGGPLFLANGYVNNDSVAPWEDEVGTADLASISGTQDPLYIVSSNIGSEPALRFDATNDGLREYLDATLTQPYTIVMVAAAGNTGGNIYFFDGRDSSPRVLIIANTQFQMYSGSTVNSGITSDTDEHLFMAYYDGTSSELEVDGTSGGTINPGTGSLEGFTLNQRYNGGNLLGYDIAFLGVYDGDVRDDPNWAEFESWVESTYGITIA